MAKGSDWLYTNPITAPWQAVFGGGDGPTYSRDDRMSRLRNAIGYDTLAGEDRAYADEYLKYHSSLPDVEKWSDAWVDQIAGKFGTSLSARKIQSDTSRARKRYSELTDINSDYNQGVYDRIKRINAPDEYEDSLLYRAMGLSGESTAFLAQTGQKQARRKASDLSYGQFNEARERAESAAQGYLDLASGKESSLLQIMTQQRLEENRLRQERELAEKERKSQLWNSIAKTVIGVGTTIAAPYLLPAVGGATAMDYLFSAQGANRMANYSSGLRYP